MLLALLMLVQAAAAPSMDPLAPAWNGRVQCHNPDLARKTCQSIGSYARAADGTIRNTAVVLLNAQPLIVMTSVEPVTIKDGAICGKISLSGKDAFTVDGAPAPEAVAATLREAVATAMAPLRDREICTSYVDDGDGLRAQVRVDAAPRPDLDIRVRWVHPSEGFGVRP